MVVDKGMIRQRFLRLFRLIGTELLIMAAAIVVGLVLIIVTGCARASASTPRGFTVSGTQVLRDGAPYVNYGFSVYDLGNGTMAFARGEYASVTAQERAIAGAWHGNTVRLQIGQYAYLHGSNGQSARVYDDKVSADIAYAESIGLVVVINDTTESTGNLATLNQPGPTSETLAFWHALRRYASDPSVILDLFNEPRYPASQWGNWNLLFHGDKTYLGENALIRDVRAMGFTNQLWVEGTGNYALRELIASWPRYKVSDPLHNFVYEYHHTTVDQGTVPTAAQWDTQFGNLVTVDGQPVVDGEWTNRSVVPGTGGTPFQPSGDVGQCWGNAPVSVPQYFAYLQNLGIGMTVWALGGGPAPYQNWDMINADGNPGGTFTVPNNYANWQGCVTPPGGHTSGAGQDIMDWFGQQDRWAVR